MLGEVLGKNVLIEVVVSAARQALRIARLAPSQPLRRTFWCRGLICARICARSVAWVRQCGKLADTAPSAVETAEISCLLLALSGKAIVNLAIANR